MNAEQIADLIEQSIVSGRAATAFGVRVSATAQSISFRLPGSLIYGAGSPDNTPPSPELLAAIDAAADGFTFANAIADSERETYAETWVYVAR